MTRARASLALMLALAGPPALHAQDTAELPPVDLAPRGAQLSSGSRVFVREFRVLGATALPAAALAGQLAPFAGRELGAEELIAARDAVTRLYLERGYITSGAVLPDQDARDGVVEIHAVEGRLDEIEIRGAKRFSAQHLRERIAGSDAGPLDIEALEQRLQLLQLEPGIERVEARLEPGAGPGTGRLRVQVVETSPWLLGAGLANDASPSLGGLRSSLLLGRRNLFGRGDVFWADVSKVQGLLDVDVRHELPLNRWDTRLALGFRRSRSEIVEDPSGQIDARGDRVSYRLELGHPLWRDRDGEWWLGAAAEHARDELRLFGTPFSFFASQVEDGGESRVTALRLWNELRLRSETRAFSARLGVSFGIDALGATIYPSRLPGSSVPDGRFLAWNAQLRWADRLDGWIEGAQLLARVDLQLARDALLPLERFALGGSRSVRGYHENELVRDSGVSAGLELRIPVLRDPLGADRLQLAPFVDFGKGWNHTRDASLESIASAGLGLHWWWNERTELALSWGSRLRTVDRRPGDDLQNAGFHISLRTATF